MRWLATISHKRSASVASPGNRQLSPIIASGIVFVFVFMLAGVFDASDTPLGVLLDATMVIESELVGWPLRVCVCVCLFFE